MNLLVVLGTHFAVCLLARLRVFYLDRLSAFVGTAEDRTQLRHGCMLSLLADTDQQQWAATTPWKADEDDQLIGFGGVDRIAGGPGKDTAFGGPLDDHISRGPANDTLYGKFGSDVISAAPPMTSSTATTLPAAWWPAVPPGGNNDTCSGGPGTNTARSCEATA